MSTSAFEELKIRLESTLVRVDQLRSAHQPGIANFDGPAETFATDDSLSFSMQIQDPAERRKAAFDLMKSLRTLSTAEQISGTGGWEYDVQTATLSRSNQLSRIIGVPHGPNLSSIDHVVELVHPDDREMMSAALTNSIANCLPYVCKYRLIRPDGRTIVISVRGEPMVDKSGKVIRVVGSTQDVTQTEEEELILEQRRRMSLLSTDLGAVLTSSQDLRQTLIRSARAICKHIDAESVSIWTINSENDEFELQASTGRHAAVPCIFESDPLAVECLSRINCNREAYFNNSLCNDSNQRVEGMMHYKSPLASAWLPLMVNERLIGALAVFSRHAFPKIETDALKAAANSIAVGVQRRNAENELRQLNTDLEMTVVARTAKLQAVLKELDTFTYHVAHELRSPLMGIDELSSMLISDSGTQLPEKAGAYLNRVRKSARGMQNLIANLLNLSSAGQCMLTVQEVDIGALVEDVIRELRLQHPDREIEIYTLDLPVVWCDLILIRQVFVNLLSNSFKYTSRTTVARIEIGYCFSENSHLFYVRDNGVGFEMQYAQKLFEAFQRLHRIEDFEGAGVGLTIVQRIVHRHGGSIWAEAQPNEGAAFYFTLKENKPDE